MRRGPRARRGSCVWGGSHVPVRGGPRGRSGLGPCLPLLGCGDCVVETRRSYKSKSKASAPSQTLASRCSPDL